MKAHPRRILAISLAANIGLVAVLAVVLVRDRTNATLDQAQAQAMIRGMPHDAYCATALPAVGDYVRPSHSQLTVPAAEERLHVCVRALSKLGFLTVRCVPADRGTTGACKDAELRRLEPGTRVSRDKLEVRCGTKRHTVNAVRGGDNSARITVHEDVALDTAVTSALSSCGLVKPPSEGRVTVLRAVRDWQLVVP